MSRAKFFRAQLGRKRGKEASFELLLSLGELPGVGWREIDERSWKTGISDDASGQIVRAREMDSITAWRSFEQTSPNRWLWVEVIPFANEIDAHSAATSVGTNLLSNARAKVQLVSERVVEDENFGSMPVEWAFEQLTSSPLGPSISLYVSGAFDNVVFVIGGSGIVATWTWEDLIEIVGLQVQRIERSRSDS